MGRSYMMSETSKSHIIQSHALELMIISRCDLFDYPAIEHLQLFWLLDFNPLLDIIILDHFSLCSTLSIKLNQIIGEWTRQKQNYNFNHSAKQRMLCISMVFEAETKEISGRKRNNARKRWNGSVASAAGGAICLLSATSDSATLTHSVGQSIHLSSNSVSSPLPVDRWRPPTGLFQRVDHRALISDS